MRKKANLKKMKRLMEKKNKFRRLEKEVGGKRVRTDLLFVKRMKKVMRNKKRGVVTAVGGAEIESAEGGVKMIKKTEAAVEETEADEKKKEPEQGVIEGADVIGVRKRKLI